MDSSIVGSEVCNCSCADPIRVVVSSDSEAKDWKAGKIFEGDVAWRTQMVKQGPRYYVVGANLAILEGGKLAVAGR